MLRAIFLADGPSDLALAGHLERLCADAGREVRVTGIDPRSDLAAGRRVGERISCVIGQAITPDLWFVHRDAESGKPDARVAEIADGATKAGVRPDVVVPVVPIRMTEAWLLLDEVEIRRVAGRPGGTNPLALPGTRHVEQVADPKELLREVLIEAGRPVGARRRAQFKRDFGQHRALLLQRLDTEGPVQGVAAWQQLARDTATALSHL